MTRYALVVAVGGSLCSPLVRAADLSCPDELSPVLWCTGASWKDNDALAVEFVSDLLICRKPSGRYTMQIRSADGEDLPAAHVRSVTTAGSLVFVVPATEFEYKLVREVRPADAGLKTRFELTELKRDAANRVVRGRTHSRRMTCSQPSRR